MIRKIEPADTLELGFRAKYNETIQEIPISATLSADGQLRFKLFGNGFFEVPLSGGFYTKEQIDGLFQSGYSLPLASEEITGIIKIATQEEVDLGDDDLKALTPSKFKNSTLLSFKGVWNQPIEDEGYPAGIVIVKDSGIYLSLINNNQSDPSSNPGQWRMLGGSDPKTIIPYSDSTVSINWQTDIAPGDTRTFAQKHGNNIGSALGIYDAGGGQMTPFTPNFTYTINGTGGIDIITFTEVFGPVTII